MFWLLLSLVIIAGLLLWLPFQVEIDTDRSMYEARWRGILSVGCLPDENGFHWRFRLFFWDIPMRGNPRQPKPDKQPEPSRSQKPFSFSLRRIRTLFRNLLRAVEVKRLYVDMDTDDFIRNAWLYPAFQLLSRGNRRLQVNFNGRQYLSLFLQIRPYRIAGAFLRTYIHS